MLPTILIARILTYNVATTIDVAELRLIGKRVGQEAIQLVVTENSTDTSNHFIQCPARLLASCDDNSRSFVERLATLDWESYECWGTLQGDCLKVPGSAVSILESAAITSEVLIRVVGVPMSLVEGATTTSASSNSANDESRSPTSIKSQHDYKCLDELCKSIHDIEKPNCLNGILHKYAKLINCLHPPPSSSSTAEEYNLPNGAKEYFAMLAMLTFWMDRTNCDCVKRIIQDKFYELQLVRPKTDDCGESCGGVKDNFHIFQPLYPGRIGCAVDFGPSHDNDNLRLVSLLMFLIIKNFAIEDSTVVLRERQEEIPIQDIKRPCRIQRILIDAVSEEHEQHLLVEGVAIVDDLLTCDFRRELNDQLDALVPVDQHHSQIDRMVRYIVDPDLYPCIQGRCSPMMMIVNDVDPGDLFPKVPIRKEPDQDFWGRSYKASKYQWLPSYISISAQGKCTFDTYINNLKPRNDPIHSVLYRSLETMLDHALPFMESVLSYAIALQPFLFNREVHEVAVGSERRPLQPLDCEVVRLRECKLQVITKIVDYEITSQHNIYDEGLWHVDGMSHDDIILTCLYILERDEMIRGGEMEFKRDFLKDEVEHLRSGDLDIQCPMLQNLIDEKCVPLGTVATPAGRLIVFPNSHIHRVKSLELAARLCSSSINVQNENKRRAVAAKYRVVSFFVVNPMKRIISTREVPPQQSHLGGKMSIEEASQGRLALVVERQARNQKWNG